MFKVKNIVSYVIEVGSVGFLSPGQELPCSEKVAQDLKEDKRFLITGLEVEKKKGGK